MYTYINLVIMYLNIYNAYGLLVMLYKSHSCFICVWMTNMHASLLLNLYSSWMEILYAIKKLERSQYDVTLCSVFF